LNFLAVESAFAEAGPAAAPSEAALPANEPAALDILKTPKDPAFAARTTAAANQFPFGRPDSPLSAKQ
jgi:hypothetical protein